jgi:spoIIIJ-associated protein
MATESYEFTGKTVDEAVAEGLKTLRLRPDQVTIEVLNKGSRGIFGLGSEPAQVRISVPAPVPAAPVPATIVEPPPIPVGSAPPAVSEPIAAAIPTTPSPVMTAPVAEESPEAEVAEEETTELVAETPTIEESDETIKALAVDLLSQTVHLMGFEATVQAAWKEGNDDLSEHNEHYLLLDVQGADLGALIGRRGETLDSLQYLLRLMVNQRLRKWKNIIVDVEGYKERRVNQLKQLAQRTAAQVAATGRAVALEPMPPHERRIIHLALRDHPDVFTESSGEGDRRKVQIHVKP